MFPEKIQTRATKADKTIYQSILSFIVFSFLFFINFYLFKLFFCYPEHISVFSKRSNFVVFSTILKLVLDYTLLFSWVLTENVRRLTTLNICQKHFGTFG